MTGHRYRLLATLECGGRGGRGTIGNGGGSGKDVAEISTNDGQRKQKINIKIKRKFNPSRGCCLRI